MKANLHNKDEYIARLQALIDKRNIHAKDTDEKIMNDALEYLMDQIVYNDEHPCEPWEDHSVIN